MSARPIITSVDALRSKEVAKGVVMRPLAGDHAMLNFVELAAGAEVPIHSHPHEQLGTVIEGRVDFWLGDEHRTMGPGDAYVAPGGVPHGAKANHGRVVILDVFYPLREDYLKP
jgi:quercetin dioxygenase-like cupin family protein